MLGEKCVIEEATFSVEMTIINHKGMSYLVFKRKKLIHSLYSIIIFTV